MKEADRITPIAPERVMEAIHKGINNAQSKLGADMPETNITVLGYRGVHNDYNKVFDIAQKKGLITDSEINTRLRNGEKSETICQKLIKENKDVKELEQAYNIVPLNALKLTKKEVLEHAQLAVKFAQDPKYKGIVTGFDIAGPEFDTSPMVFKESFDVLKTYNLANPDNKIGITVHAGETPTTIDANGNMVSSKQGIIEAVNLGTNRIGHGLQAFDSPEIMSLLKKNNVTVEINATCNINSIPEGVKGMSYHPVKNLNENGVKLAVCSDNQTMCGTDPGLEFTKMSFLGYEDLTDINRMREIVLNGVESGFTSKETKDKLNLEINNQFDRTIDLFMLELVE